MTAAKKKVERGKGRPKDGYSLEGARIPGTTTITGRFKEPGGLIRWAYKRGKRNLELYEPRDKAGELGTIVHEAIEEDIHHGRGLKHLAALELSDRDREKCTEAFEAYREWRGGVKLEMLATEIAMVSEEHRFGGTLDAVARINGKLVILDWKTSNDVYRDYIVQLGGYAILWKETRGESFEGAHLLRVSKKSGAFAHHYWPKSVLRLGAEQFLLLREAHALDWELKEAM